MFSPCNIVPHLKYKDVELHAMTDVCIFPLLDRFISSAIKVAGNLMEITALGERTFS